ncbi:EG45-like domain containing protein [Melia azedarach]|uniref:EG45-like domain containing protein n=1 Tax=Melia azedarach TaxID=155640 RepID=A0ACC1XDN0_MELAZ|nr:EG45-like domain containing protein [Melia azedarach]
MEIEIMRIIFMLLSIVLCLSSASVHAAQGNAVYYAPPYKPSKCNGNRDDGPLVAGVSDALWDNGRACGRRYRVTCIGGTNQTPNPCKAGRSVIVKVVDFCRSPCDGILNLSQDAFNRIANLKAGNVKVEYNQV